MQALHRFAFAHRKALEGKECAEVRGGHRRQNQHRFCIVCERASGVDLCRPTAPVVSWISFVAWSCYMCIASLH